MGMKGQTKFVCAECGGFTFIRGLWMQARHSRDRCRHCGSHCLDPASSAAKEEQLRLSDRGVRGAGEVPLSDDVGQQRSTRKRSGRGW